MKRYNVNPEVVEKNQRLVISNVIACLVSLVAFFYCLIRYWDLDFWEGELEGPLTAWMVITAIFTIWGFVGFLTVIRTDGCLKANYLIIEPNKISGMHCRSLKDPNDANFFSLMPDEIELVECMNLSKTNQYYTLQIHTKHGSYRLCIEQASDAARRIKDCGRQEEEKPQKADSHEWACPLCGKMIDAYPCKHCHHGSETKLSRIPTHAPINGDGDLICPVCQTVQKPRRKVCFKCGQPFANNQPSPYWCGKCGNYGPYNGPCPKCGSTIRIFNR